MDCELFPDFNENPLCNHFDRLNLQEQNDKEVEVSDPQRCETCSCSSSFINLNTYGLDHQQTAKRTRAINQVSVMITETLKLILTQKSTLERLQISKP